MAGKEQLDFEQTLYRLRKGHAAEGRMRINANGTNEREIESDRE
jgi:hypothetical protein